MTRTLLEVLQQRFPDSSKTTLRKMLQSERVRVGGITERDAKRAIDDEAVVEIAGSRETRRLDPRVRIVFEDDELIVVNKAAGILTVANDAEKRQTVEAVLGAFLRRDVHVVQRLDYDTSGVVVFAKNADMRARLQELFAAHDIERIYIAVVHGELDPPSGTFRSLLAEDRELRVSSVDDGGKEAITHYATIAAGNGYSLLEVTLETGRRNQIRVHLSEAGHPVVGDPMYGHAEENPLRRLGLHAKHLGFVHPRSRKRMSFTEEAPQEFAGLLNRR